MGGLKEKVRLLIEKTIQTEHGLANHLPDNLPDTSRRRTKVCYFPALDYYFSLQEGSGTDIPTGGAGAEMGRNVSPAAA